MDEEVMRKLDEISDGIAKVLDVVDPDKLASLFKEYWRDLIKVGWYTKRAMISIVNEFWYKCLLHSYALTDLITLYPILIRTTVNAGETRTFNVDLTDTNLCCVCPILKASATLGDWVTLTCVINKTPVDVIRNWQNKTLPNKLPLTSDIREYPFVVFPKRKIQITFENDGSTSSNATFYVPGMLIELRRAQKLISKCYKDLVEVFNYSIGIVTPGEEI